MAMDRLLYRSVRHTAAGLQSLANEERERGKGKPDEHEYEKRAQNLERKARQAVFFEQQAQAADEPHSDITRSP